MTTKPQRRPVPRGIGWIAVSCVVALGFVPGLLPAGAANAGMSAPRDNAVAVSTTVTGAQARPQAGATVRPRRSATRRSVVLSPTLLSGPTLPVR